MKVECNNEDSRIAFTKLKVCPPNKERDCIYENEGQAIPNNLKDLSLIFSALLAVSNISALTRTLL